MMKDEMGTEPKCIPCGPWSRVVSDACDVINRRGLMRLVAYIHLVGQKYCRPIDCFTGF
jgi:hypothetical protein